MNRSLLLTIKIHKLQIEIHRLRLHLNRPSSLSLGAIETTCPAPNLWFRPTNAPILTPSRGQLNFGAASDEAAFSDDPFELGMPFWMFWGVGTPAPGHLQVDCSSEGMGGSRSMVAPRSSSGST